MSADGDLAAIILAGGQGTRMGGVDKALLSLGEGRVIDHILSRLRPGIGRIAINANGDPARWAEFGLPCIPDPVEGYPGPLAGILAGMEWAAAQGVSRVVSVAGDTPFFPLDLVRELLAQWVPGSPVIAASQDDAGEISLQPTFALWPVSLRDDLRASLLQGERKLRVWAMRHGARQALFPGGPDAFFNINTPAELSRALTMVKRLP